MQSAPPAQAQAWQQEREAYKQSVRTSDPATIQNALKNFNGVQMNPSKLYAPGAPASNVAPLTPQEQQAQQQQTQAPQQAPLALAPAQIVCECSAFLVSTPPVDGRLLSPNTLTNVRPAGFALLPEGVEWMQTEAKVSRRMLPGRPARLPRRLPRWPNQQPRGAQPPGQLSTQPLLALSKRLPPARLRHLLPTRTPLTLRQQRPPPLCPTATSTQVSKISCRRHHCFAVQNWRCPWPPVQGAFLPSFCLGTETASNMPVCSATYTEVKGSGGLPDAAGAPAASESHLARKAIMTS